MASIWTLSQYYPVIPKVTFLLIASFSISFLAGHYNRLSSLLDLFFSYSQAYLCKPLLHFKRLSPQPNWLLYAFALLLSIFLSSHLTLSLGFSSFCLQSPLFTTPLPPVLLPIVTVKLLGSSCPALFLHSIFTTTPISLDLSLRQWETRYPFHTCQQLIDY